MLRYEQWLEEYADSEEVQLGVSRGMTYYSLYTLYKESLLEEEYYSR